MTRRAGKGLWLLFAVLSSVFAALTAILAKIGTEGVESNLAVAIRTMVVLVMAWAMVFVTGSQGSIHNISQKSWYFLILSGIATGVSWLCYFRAIEQGPVSVVVPVDKLSVVITVVLAAVFLGEQITPVGILGCILIAVGTLLMTIQT